MRLHTAKFDLGNKGLNVVPQINKRASSISAAERPIECVFLLVHSWDNPRLIDVLMAQLRVLSIPIYLLPDRNVARFLNNRIVNIGNAWTAELTRAPLSPAEQACKRAIDLLFASAALVILAPIMILTAAWIKIETRGPIFFTQRRSGFNGRTFKIYKFRTMSVDEDGPLLRQATRNDPRVTNCGRLLRRTNIDELPQLLNVIAGDMSLVGPRPHPLALNSEYEDVIGNYAFRHHVKPGLTGWAQVNGARGETQTVELMARRVEFDLWYINNWSLWLGILEFCYTHWFSAYSPPPINLCTCSSIQQLVSFSFPNCDLCHPNAEIALTACLWWASWNFAERPGPRRKFHEAVNATFTHAT